MCKCIHAYANTYIHRYTDRIWNSAAGDSVGVKEGQGGVKERSRRGQGGPKSCNIGQGGVREGSRGGRGGAEPWAGPLGRTIIKEKEIEQQTIEDLNMPGAKARRIICSIRAGSRWPLSYAISIINNALVSV